MMQRRTVTGLSRSAEAEFVRTMRFKGVSKYG